MSHAKRTLLKVQSRESSQPVQHLRAPERKALAEWSTISQSATGPYIWEDVKPDTQSTNSSFMSQLSCAPPLVTPTEYSSDTPLTAPVYPAVSMTSQQSHQIPESLHDNNTLPNHVTSLGASSDLTSRQPGGLQGGLQDLDTMIPGWVPHPLALPPSSIYGGTLPTGQPANGQHNWTGFEDHFVPQTMGESPATGLHAMPNYLPHAGHAMRCLQFPNQLPHGSHGLPSTDNAPFRSEMQPFYVQHMDPLQQLQAMRSTKSGGASHRLSGFPNVLAAESQQILQQQQHGGARGLQASLHDYHGTANWLVGQEDSIPR